MSCLIDRKTLNVPKTILLVDDIAEVRQWIHGELEKLGYDLLEASDGDDALVIAELHRGPIDLVITDVAMPRVNGTELVQRLRSLRPHFKVLYISGYPEELKRAGLRCDDYIQKPFDIITLTARIELLLRAKEGEENHEMLSLQSGAGRVARDKC